MSTVREPVAGDNDDNFDAQLVITAVDLRMMIPNLFSYGRMMITYRSICPTDAVSVMQVTMHEIKLEHD